MRNRFYFFNFSLNKFSFYVEEEKFALNVSFYGGPPNMRSTLFSSVTDIGKFITSQSQPQAFYTSVVDNNNCNACLYLPITLNSNS